MSALKKFISNIEDYIVWIVFTPLIGLMFLQVVARYCFGIAWGWMEQITRIMYVYVGFAGMSLVSKHKEHLRVSFVAEFEPLEEKTFTYEEQPALEEKLFTRTAWVGAERVRDIINDYDTESYKLPYGLENDFFRISWKVGVVTFITYG